jgi:hypothetical protein
VATLALALAACDPAGIAVSQGPTNSAAPSDSDPAGLGSTPPDGPDDTPGASITVDPSLLGILPPSIDGVPITEATENEASLATEPSLMPTAAALAVGYAVASGDSATEDLAVVSVIRLRPGVFSTQFWEGWRQSYDEAACEPAGGVASHTQQVFGANTAEITVCTEGARTYHVHLANDTLISITAVGDRHFGDLVLAGLRG